MNNTSAYLDIYKDKEIVIKQSYDFKNEKEKDIFFDYLEKLKKQEISFYLVDENDNLVYKYENKNKNYKFNQEVNLTSEEIKNILLLENDCELKDTDWKKIEFLSKEKLHKILKQEHHKIKVVNNSKLYKKLNEIYALLEKWATKVTLTESWTIEEELEGFGSGTMFVDLEEADFKKLNNDKLFYQIFDYQFKKWNWKKRTKQELENLSKNYEVYELNWTILWGFALSDSEIEINWKNKKAKLLENLFAVKEWWWIGYILAEKIKENELIFAYSKQEEFFSKIWFKKVEGKKSESWADLWVFKKLVEK